MMFILRSIWFLIVSASAAYGTFLVAGSMTTSTHGSDPIVVRDHLRVGEHHLSGMITVPTPCDEISVRSEKIDWNTYVLEFTTWTEPSVRCDKTPVPRAFSTTVFAPSVGVEFLATLDGKSLPVAVFPILRDQ